ncbi:MAG TPA: serine/threonine-protein kinase [Planctomycetota bacterium]|nr:serine/threonine-protein kinase [Planctomycetota bacterium]
MARKAPATFEELAIENGLVTETQVQECIAAQGPPGGDGTQTNTIETIMLAKGFMNEDQVRAIKTALGRLQRDEEKGDALRIGNYEIIGKIGDGGLGTVYKARQISMSRDVALKVLHKKWLSDEEFKKRFLLEARLAGRLSHQNLIQVYDVGRDRGVYYFSMEFIDGETVEDMIDRVGPLDVPVAMDITIQIMHSIHYIKQWDIVHRDIKPGNMMMTRKGQVKLGDFGFVKSKLDPVISTEGEVLGTPDYISPEQAMGADNIDWRSDQYSLGCSLYHMLTGKPPYEGSGSSVMRQHIKAELPDPRTINPKIPDPVMTILERMMAKNPADRFQDAAHLIEDLELVKMGQSPSSARLDAGKSTIIRAYKIEQVRVERAKTEIELLRDEVRRMKMYVTIACIVAATMVIVALLVFLLKK